MGFYTVMPSIPKITKCATLRCESPRVEGSAHCEAHGGRPKLSAQRMAHNAPYKSAAWAQIRSAQLSRAPLCERCKMDGRITAAVQVDHIFPWSVIGGESFRRNLFASLCTPCHSLKTAAERRGVFERYTENGVIQYTASDYRRILGE